MVAVTGTAVECKLEESIDGEKKVAAKASPNLMCSSSTGQTVSGAIGVGVATGLLKPDKKSAIPEISYSSSDDDDFYDAEDQGRRARRGPTDRLLIYNFSRHGDAVSISYIMLHTYQSQHFS